MKIHLITCGNLNSPEKAIFEEYNKRINLFPVLLKEINVKGDLEENFRIQKESLEIMKYLSNFDLSKPDKNQLIILDIFGKNYDSVEFSHVLNGFLLNSIKNLIFIIGGAFGISEDLKKLSKMKISFGKATWPHNLMKVMLIEQIFRAQSIIFEKKYHK